MAAAPLLVRATNVVVGQEIVRFIVDDANAVRFAQAQDHSRLSDQMRWPVVMHANILNVVPSARMDGFTSMIAAVRSGEFPEPWVFRSVICPTEWRLLHAWPIKTHRGWVGLSVLKVTPQDMTTPAEDDEDDLVSSGGLSCALLLTVVELARGFF